MGEILNRTLAAIVPPNEMARQRGLERHARLTKPAGSLGRLEELGTRLCAITGLVPPPIGQRAVLVFAADHGISQDGVSAYPREVTGQMVANFLRGGAAINVLARQSGAVVRVVDMGVASALPANPALIRRSLGPGTRSFVREPAMDRSTAMASIETGIEVASEAIAAGAGLVACGEMGIGNTSAAAALTAVFCERAPREVTGRGTGIDEQSWNRKVGLLEQSLALHRPDRADPIGVLAAVGGFEIGAIAGAILGCAAKRVPMVLDGFIAGAGALIAQALAPTSTAFLIAAHRSAEPGHIAALEKLGVMPLFDLGLRLGEGTGAALAFPLIEAASRVMAEMATFDEAGVSGKEAHEPVVSSGAAVSDGSAGSSRA